MPSLSPAELLQHLEDFDENDAGSLPTSLRARLQSAARNLSIVLETPADTVSRILITQPADAVTIRIAADLGLFSTLGHRTSTRAELALATGVDAEFLGRVLRSLAAFNAVKQIDMERFSASTGFAMFQQREFELAIGTCQDVLEKIRTSLPEFLAITEYKFPKDVLDTVVQHAYGKTFYESILSEPTGGLALRSFSLLMSTWAEGFTQIQDIYPVKERLERGFDDPICPMFVDVGGGFGQKAIALKKALPNLPGRFVVQDLAPRIQEAREVESTDKTPYIGIELMSHDFTTEQPEKGARCHYLRQCLHNWRDSDCVTILKRIKDAATPAYTRILIHEIIVPEKGAGPRIASQDIEMMSFFATGERTEADWRTLCNKTELQVSGIYLNDHPSCEGIVEINV